MGSKHSNINECVDHKREGDGFAFSGKLKLQFVSGREKTPDYVKILNDLSLAQKGRHLCGEEWIFQQDNAAFHNASITFLNKK